MERRIPNESREKDKSDSPWGGIVRNFSKCSTRSVRSTSRTLNRKENIEKSLKCQFLTIAGRLISRIPNVGGTSNFSKYPVNQLLGNRRVEKSDPQVEGEWKFVPSLPIFEYVREVDKSDPKLHLQEWIISSIKSYMFSCPTYGYGERHVALLLL